MRDIKIGENATGKSQSREHSIMVYNYIILKNTFFFASVDTDTDLSFERWCKT